MASNTTPLISDGKTVEITTIIQITESVSYPPYVAVKVANGGGFNIAAGKTLTIEGPFEAGKYRVFWGDGYQNVIGLTEARGAWWGGDSVPDGVVVSNAEVRVLGVLFPHDILFKGPWVDVRAFGVTGPGTTDWTAKIQEAVDYAVTNGFDTVYFPVAGQYRCGALTGLDTVVLMGNGAYFNPAYASYKINQVAGVAGKPGVKYAAYGGVPRCNGMDIISMTRSGSTVTVTVASTVGMNPENYVTIRGATQPEYNQTFYPFNITATTFQWSIGTTPASPATGTLKAYWWQFIDDSGHSPTGFYKVTTPDINTIRVWYSDTANKISQFTAVPDDALAPHGVVVGGDVGTTYANIKAFVPLCCSFNGGGSSHLVPALVNVPPLLSGALSVQNAGAGYRKLLHPAVQAGDVPVVSVVSKTPGSQPKDITVAFDSTSVTVAAVSPISGYVSWNGSAFAQALSDNVAAPTLAWNSTTGALRVTFESNTNDQLPPMITPHGGVYSVQTVNVGTNYFEVSFFNSTGTKITGAANANMAFTYRMNTAKTLAEWPDDMAVTVRRGLVPIRTDDYVNVPGNNFWISGLMEAL